MSARTSQPTRLRRGIAAAGIIAAALTIGSIAPAMASPLPTGTVTSAPDAYSRTTQPSLAGTTYPNAELVLHLDATDIPVEADGNGDWDWFADADLADGHHTYDVTVDDVSIGSGSFDVDTTDPVVTLAPLPGDTSSATSVTFTWSATDADPNLEYHWIFDENDEETGAGTSVTLNDLSEGRHWFSVWAVDAAGNYSEGDTYNYTVELPAVPGPEIAWAGTPAASSTSTSAHFAVTAPAGTEIAYMLDLSPDAQSSNEVAIDGTEFTLDGLSVGHHTITILASLNGGYSSIDYAWDVTAAGAPAAPAPAAKAPVLAKDAIPAGVINRGIKAGASGPSVSLIQSIVGTPADGKFGPKTSAAVKAFQRAHGLVADGIVGPLTWAAIVDVANGGTGIVPVTAQSIPARQIAKGIKSGSSGPAVLVVQSALGVPANGKFDAKTKAAVTAYQASHGLKVDGIVGPLTWAVLFGKH